MTRDLLAIARRADVQVTDMLLAVAVTALIAAEYLTDPHLTTAQQAVGVAVGLGIGYLVARRRTLSLPLVVAILVVAVCRVVLPEGSDGMAWAVAAAVAAYAVAAESPTRPALWGLASSLATAFVVMAYDGEVSDFSSILFYCGWFTAPWLAGRAVRGWQHREGEAVRAVHASEADREQSMRVAVAEERTRIARELHDVIGHAVSVMVIQADGAKRIVHADPEKARQALETIEQTGRQALVETRRLVELIRDIGDEDLAPQPTLARLDELVADYRKAGLQVETHVRGDPVALPRSVDLSAYRIIQESLTNVLKHSGAQLATVEVEYGSEGLRLSVSDPGAGADHRRLLTRPGDGHGLLGVHERVAVFGGTVTAGPAEEGGFVVSVELPYAVRT